MKIHSITTLALMTVAALAGCTSQASTVAPAGPGDHGNPHEEATEIIAIPVTGIYEDYATGGAVWCGTPPDCHPYLSFGINFTGTLTGEAMGIASDSPPDPAHPDHANFEKKPVTFNGAIEGCGSGSLGFVIKGYLQPTAQDVFTNETIEYVPGSASTGFARVVDIFASFDGDSYAWPGPVKLSGTVWCRAETNAVAI